MIKLKIKYEGMQINVNMSNPAKADLVFTFLYFLKLKAVDSALRTFFCILYIFLSVGILS